MNRNLGCNAIFLSALFGMLFFAACNEFDSEIKVNPVDPTAASTLQVNTTKGALYLESGIYKVRVKLAGDDSTIAFLNAKGDETDVSMKVSLPAVDDVLNVLDPVEVPATKVGQPFSVVIMRDVDVDYDTVGITFRDQASTAAVASMQIQHKGDRVAFDENKQEFLRSYQKVKYSQRGVVFPIDGQLDTGFWSTVLDRTVNFSAAVFIAPWVYSRYSKVEWALSNDAEDAAVVSKKWASVFKSRPVVDYFAFTHGGADESFAEGMVDQGKKRNQLRLVYTEGCGSGSAYTFIKNYNAAASVGHKATSASPFFAFPLVRGWTYGKSMLDTVKKGWEDGKAWANGIDLLTIRSISSAEWASADDMLASSELMFSWTKELPPEKLFIGLSAVPERNQELTQQIVESSITKYDPKDSRTIQPAGSISAQPSPDYPTLSIH